MEFNYDNLDKATEWIGVDFDGTLSSRPPHSMASWEDLGTPVPLMLERVKAWLAEGITVKIMTARVSYVKGPNEGFTNKLVFVDRQKELLTEWCKEYLGQALELVCWKDPFMYHLYDDRAVCIERNTGKILGINSRW
jgi:hypothetical protein